ncbi:hypothetical protein AA313_de0200037 [Arthrobotrys entomopaga]|nr:hypothetical protein AA313_de0200037 [Arthrobotrys entomopaga]
MIVVSNPNGPIVSTVAYCNPFPDGLQFCENIIWLTFQLTSTITGATSMSPTTASSSVSSPVSSASVIPSSFVLGGSGALEGFYLQTDATGNVLLSTLGENVLLAFQLDNSLVLNSQDTSQILFLRRNSSFLVEEDPAVLAEIRQIRIGNREQLTSADVYKGWTWDNQTYQLQFLDKDQTLSFYYSRTGLGRLRARNPGLIPAALPFPVSLPRDSSLEPLSLTPSAAATFSSSFFSTPPSRTATSASITIPSSKPTLSTSSGLTSSDLISSGLSASTTFGSSSSNLVDAYQIITQYSLQAYCSSLLAYSTPVEKLPSTIYTGTTEEGLLSTTTISTTTSTLTSTIISTSTTYEPTSISVVERDDPTPSQLSGYAPTAIRSGCSKAITPPSTTTSYDLVPLEFVSFVSTTSTSILTLTSSELPISTSISLSTYTGIGMWVVAQAPGESALTAELGFCISYYKTIINSGAQDFAVALLTDNPSVEANVQARVSGTAPDGTLLYQMYADGFSSDWVLCGYKDPPDKASSYVSYFNASTLEIHGAYPLIFRYDPVTKQAALDNAFTYATAPQYFFACDVGHGLYMNTIDLLTVKSPDEAGSCDQVGSIWQLQGLAPP